MKLQLSRSSGKPASVSYEDSGVKLEIVPYSKAESEWIEKLNTYKARPDWEELDSDTKERYSGAAMAGTILTNVDSFKQPGENGGPEFTVNFHDAADPEMQTIGLRTMGEQLLFQDKLLKQFVFEFSYERANHYDLQAREIVKKSSPAMPSIPL